MNNPLEILILHERPKHRDGTFKTAFERLKYLLSDKRQPGEKAPIGPRVAAYRTHFRDGVKGLQDPATDSKLLMAGSNCSGRCQVVEFVVSARAKDAARLGRDYVMGELLYVAKRLMQEFYPGVYYAAVCHQDVDRVHVHLCAVNDLGNGLCISLDKDNFLRMRTQIATWTKGRCVSSWGTCKAIEHKFASLSNEEILNEVAAGRLRITKRDKRLRKLTWLPGWASVSSTIRWWETAGLLGTRADWLELSIVKAYEIAQHRIDLVKANAMLQLQARELPSVQEISPPGLTRGV